MDGINVKQLTAAVRVIAEEKNLNDVSGGKIKNL
jgi:hypothetical protein